MPGVITKRTILRHPLLLYRLGGFRLIWAMLLAKPGIPFLTLYQVYRNV